ncbi:MAG: nuclear transport factor 2 family protein [Algicola sp.]|nr:nuclear transport factor 2 family protein [Algicola sp.]
MDLEQLAKLEKTLQQYATRNDKQHLEQLIHDDFIEIGYSGTSYGKKDIIDSLLNEAKPAHSPWSQNVQFIQLTENTIQLIYQQARLEPDGQLSRHAKRCSIWQINDGQWQIRFHQGTPTAAFEKSETVI